MLPPLGQIHFAIIASLILGIRLRLEKIRGAAT